MGNFGILDNVRLNKVSDFLKKLLYLKLVYLRIFLFDLIYFRCCCEYRGSKLKINFFFLLFLNCIKNYCRWVVRKLEKI